MNIELLKKYFNNTCLPEEVDEVVLWFKTNTNDIEGRSVLKQLWEELEESEVHDVDFDQMLDKIHHRINIENSKVEDISQMGKKNVIKPFFSVIIKIAASLFIPLLAVSLYYYSRDISYNDKQTYSEIISPNGSRTTFELPDGSKVWLNNGSRLKFPIRFTGDYRNLELSGEAYFQIAHDKDRPLVVKTGELQVMVHGTEFNLMSYPNDDDIVITLESGSISLQKQTSKIGSKDILRLKPNQQAIYNKTIKGVEYMNVNPEKFTSWRNGKLIFIDDPIDVVMDKLER
jgi:hypothetical protein